MDKSKIPCRNISTYGWCKFEKTCEFNHTIGGSFGVSSDNNKVINVADVKYPDFIPSQHITAEGVEPSLYPFVPGPVEPLSSHLYALPPHSKSSDREILPINSFFMNEDLRQELYVRSVECLKNYNTFDRILDDFDM
jgi:hypothetical protein